MTERYVDVGGDFLVDLLPYKITNTENFYFRNHPKNINPNTFAFKSYWGEFEKNCIEGKWIKDGDTWFYIMPKLFFYLNYVIISDKDRNRINPRLRDNEIMFFTYFLCCEGFSGFTGDEKYTCNKYVKKLQDGEKLQPYELKELESSTGVKNSQGEYKIYVDPWEYLTETYCVTDKRDYPLGDPIYDNGYYHAMVLASRAVAKSFVVFMGLFLHEWIFSGVKKQSSKKDINNALLFGIAASETKALGRSVANLDRAYFSFPGQYDFPTKKKGKTVKYWGPFYKNTRGQWKLGNGPTEVRHLVKTKQGKTIINGSQVQIAPIASGNDKIFAGDRFRMGILEEVGFIPNLKDILTSGADAFKVGKKQVGMIVMLGTSGDMEKIKDSKEVFENPEAYNVFGIPNYWLRGTTHNKKCALFLGAQYKSEELKENGNTILTEALYDVIRYREEKRLNVDIRSFIRDLAYNPIYPKELLRPTRRSVLPTAELSEHMDKCLEEDFMTKLSVVGSFKYKGTDVEFKPDFENTLNPILEWGKDEKLEDRTGAWVIHEQPPSYIPDGLYYVLFDPYAQGGEGTSLQSILIYKHKFKSDVHDLSLQDTIVASYIGRIPNLEQAYEEVIKASRYFNAKVFPEMNVTGFAEFVDRKNYQQYMLYIPKQVLEPIKGSTANSHGKSIHGYGIKVNKDMNDWSLAKLADWMLTPTMVDKVTKIPIKRNFQTIRDLRLLSEAINFDMEQKQDFDAMSALMLLPYVLSYLDGTMTELVTLEAEEDIYAKYSKKQFRGGGVSISKLSKTI